MSVPKSIRWLLLLTAGASAIVAGPRLAQAHCRANESAKVLASDGAAYDQFGSSAGIWADTAVFGARFDQDNGEDSGAAYVFRFNGRNWVEEAKLLPDDGAPGDFFGHSAAMFGDTVLIGAIRTDDNGADSGAAYVFRFDGVQWVQQQKLLPDDGAASENFGESVVVRGDVALVGAFFDNDNGSGSGSVYAFRFNGSSWVQEQKLLASDGAAGDQFGVSLALAGDPSWRAVIGAYADDDNGSLSGSAYVFHFNGATWVQEQKLLPDDGAAGDEFGWAVGATGPPLWRFVIGAFGDDDNGSLSGSAYVFRLDGATWVQEQKLLASDGSLGRIFGKSLAASGSLALIGSHRDKDQGNYSGAAYIFRHNGSIWIEEAKILPSDGAAEDRFAWSVALAGETAAIGAHRNDDSGTDSGSGYLFRGLSDCNTNGTLDLCDIAEGTSRDDRGTGLPDECDPVLPALSQWGLIAMTVLVAGAGGVVIGRRRTNGA
ncbi:MAG TPA: IPTL-CTERM sorting domain-containing protein [Phycisphaerae bacterium]|nr:IPTL-CTERM sorting domain-containing protein [Phycisphaerae bacterium]